MNLEKFTRDDLILGGVSLVAVIDLLFFPWYSVSVGLGSYSVSVTGSATGAPDAFLGILAMIGAVVVVADLAMERLSPQTQLPSVRGSRQMTRFAFAAAAAVCFGLKFLFNIHFSDFGWGFYLGVILIVAMVVLTRRERPAGIAGIAT